MRPGLLFVLLAGMLTPAVAQDALRFEVHPDYTARQWTIRDGLPASTLLEILQAEDGYLWMSSNEGIARFDGQRFTIFSASNTPTLPSSRVDDLTAVAGGQVWVRTNPEGLGFIQNGQFTQVMGEGQEPGVVLLVEGDTLWVSTTEGLARYTNGSLEPYRPEILTTTTTAAVRDGQGRLWVGMGREGLYRFDPDGEFRHYREEDGLPTQTVVDLHVDHEARVWVGMQGAALYIQDERFVPVERPDGGWKGSVHIGLEDAAGGVWLHEYGSAWWRHDPSGQITAFPVAGGGNYPIQIDPEGQRWRADDTRLYRGDEVIFEVENGLGPFTFDQQGNVWVGVTRAGLFRLRRSVLRTISTPEGLPNRNVYPVLEDQQGDIWVGSDGGGLARISGGQVVQTLMPGEAIRALHEDHAGRLWVSAGSVCRLEGARCIPVSTPIDGRTSFGILAIHEDRQGRAWLGGSLGIVKGVPEGDAYAWTVYDAEDEQQSYLSRVRAILETTDDVILFGTVRGGLLRYKEDGGFEALTTADGLASNNIRDIYEDADAYLWTAHEDRGLCRVDRQGRLSLAGAEVACLSRQQGLYWDGLHRIIEDDQGRFWFNTNNGIFWVERAALMAYFAGEVEVISSVSYTEVDGMRNREGNGARKPAGIKASDGQLWFPTQDGVVILDPASVPVPMPPPVVIEGFQVEGEARAAAASLTLRPRERDVTFGFTALEYTRPEDVRFQHLMEGYDQGWREAGRQRQATYTNLPHGSFVLQVRAGLGGRWGPVATVRIERSQYSWLSWWFLTLVGLVLLAGAYGVYRYRVSQVEARNRELEQKVAERTAQLSEKTAELEAANEHKARFLANISHEFRTPLTLLFGPLDDLLTGRYQVEAAARPHLERAKRNGSRLLRLINQLLDLSKLDAGALLLRSQRHDLAKHLRQLAALFNSIAETQGIDYATRIPSEPLWHVYDADKIEKVVVNLLSNAFKFTPQGRKVAIALEQTEEGGVRIIVADTGSGVPEEALPHLFDRFYQVEGVTTRTHEGSGIGLALVKELVELHGGTIGVESQVGFGTRFRVYLPQRAADEVEPADPQATSLPEDDSKAPWEAVEAVPSTGQAERDHTISESLRILRVPEPDAIEALPDEATVVLVVEDNTDMRQYIRGHLEDHFTVVEAENGRVGVERALAVVPDLVLSDVMMPEMDGLAACAALKANPATSHIPVVLLTARAQVEHRIEGFESGADAYLPKPFNAEELVVRVRTLIEVRRQLQTRYAGAPLAPAPVAKDAAPQAAEAAAFAEAPGLAEQAQHAAPSRREVAFLEEVEGLIRDHIADALFGAEALAEALNLGPRQFRRKLRALIGETPVNLVRRLRMEEAARLLDAGALSVKEVMYEVGFTSISGFSRSFRQVYGIPPSEYAERDEAGGMGDGVDH